MALAACGSESEEPEPQRAVVEAPQPVMTSAPTPIAAADGTPIEPGQWFVTEDAEGARALFGAPRSDGKMILSCAYGASQVRFALESDASEPQSWRLDAGGEAARIDLEPSDGELPQLEAYVDQGLAIINALGASGQTFALTSPDGQRRQFPTHPGIRRVIAACT
ncbi:hypothetical protein D6201_00700 [Aurantiacibacter aquimixticola]|uniref:Uncharacterized protein n=2 Tax=Aurantiacibacter aquimixticola TaxID=1958945 RepID=A0A419RQH4_9SPHN|nr:hypothetical protein D6201_00700 [Aurantiacibacter aquimixticola]